MDTEVLEVGVPEVRASGADETAACLNVRFGLDWSNVCNSGADGRVVLELALDTADDHKKGEVFIFSKCGFGAIYKSFGMAVQGIVKEG